jgi:hypothetical protein
VGYESALEVGRKRIVADQTTETLPPLLLGIDTGENEYKYKANTRRIQMDSCPETFAQRSLEKKAKSNPVLREN